MKLDYQKLYYDESKFESELIKNNYSSVIGENIVNDYFWFIYCCKSFKFDIINNEYIMKLAKNYVYSEDDSNQKLEQIYQLVLSIVNKEELHKFIRIYSFIIKFYYYNFDSYDYITEYYYDIESYKCFMKNFNFDYRCCLICIINKYNAGFKAIYCYNIFLQQLYITENELINKNK